MKDEDFYMSYSITSILEAIFDFFGIIMQTGACAILNWAISAFVGGDITVSPNYLYENLFVDFNISSLQHAFIVSAVILTIILLTFAILRHGLGSLLEAKDSFLENAFRFFVCLFAATFIYTGFDYVFELAQSVMESAFEEKIQYTGANTYLSSATNAFSDSSLTGQDSLLTYTKKISNINSLNDPVLATFDSLLGLQIGIPILSDFLLAIIHSVFFLIMAYNYFKLCVELIKRYITMCSLYLIAPPFTAFFITAETQLVTLSFVKLFGTTVMVFCFSKIWIFLSAYVLAHVNVSFVNMFAVIAFITFGVRIEAIFKEIGLSTANLGGALLDSVVATAGVMAYATKGLAGGIGNGLVNAGALAGNMNMVAAGSALTKRSLAPDQLAATMAGSAGGVMREKMGAKASGLSNFNQSIGKNLNDVLRTGGISRNFAAQKLLDSLNAAGKEQAYKSIMSSQYGSLSNMLDKKKFSVSNMSYDPIKGFTMDLKGENGLTRRASISTVPASGTGVTSYGFKDGNGRVSYLNMDSPWEQLKDMKNSPFTNIAGETISDAAYSGTLTRSELNTGVRYAPFIQKDANGAFDNDAANYEQRVNPFGNVDIYYGSNPEERELLGTSTKDGLHLYSGNGSDSIKKPEDVALAFAKKGQDIKFEYPTANGGTETKKVIADFDGIFANAGISNVTHIQRNKDGSFTFKYEETLRSKEDGKKYTSEHVGTIDKAYRHQMDVNARNTAGNDKVGSYIFIRR